jgi:hypothetical protein
VRRVVKASQPGCCGPEREDGTDAGATGRASLANSEWSLYSQLDAALALVGNDPEEPLEVTKAHLRTERQRADVLVLLARRGLVLAAMHKRGIFKGATRPHDVGW